MRTLCVWAWAGLAVWAQFPLYLPVSKGFGYGRRVAVATGREGDLWVAGERDVVRLDAQGRTRFTARVAESGRIEALATGADGRAAVATDKALTVLDGEGRTVWTVPVPGALAAAAIDGAGDIYVAGRGVTKIRGSDGAQVWRKDLGRGADDSAWAVAVDAAGQVWVAGTTSSSDFPVTEGALPGRCGRGNSDAFLARLRPGDGGLAFSTCLGGEWTDEASVLVAVEGGVLVAGSTDSPEFPVTADAYQKTLTDPRHPANTRFADSFVAFFGLAGNLVYSTFYGQKKATGAYAAGRGPGDEIVVALAGTGERCVARVRARTSVTSFTTECGRAAFEEPFAPARVGENWMAVGQTLPGLPIPGNDPDTRLTVQYLGGDNPAAGVVQVWSESVSPTYRPVLAAGSFGSMYLPGGAGAERAVVTLGGRAVPILYAGGSQINFAVPEDMPLGTHLLTAGFPFFTTLPVPVDVVARWPGLAEGALNEDGTVNSAANPAERGTIVSLFATGLGPAPLPVIEPYVSSTGVTTAQGMEVLYAGRVAEGLFQINARLPMNAVLGRAAVRVVLRMPDGFLLSRLVMISTR